MFGTAQTGDQALALVEKLQPDLIITDIRMPVMDGIALLTRVRANFPISDLSSPVDFQILNMQKKPSR